MTGKYFIRRNSTRLIFAIEKHDKECQPQPMLRTLPTQRLLRVATTPLDGRYVKDVVRISPRRRLSSLWSKPVTVPNTGSFARDILATERTFLAWSRTGLGFVGAGSALFAAYHRNKDQKTHPGDDESLPFHMYLASSLLVGNGSFLLLFATRRYLRTVASLQKKQFLVDTRGTVIAIAVTATSTLASLGVAFHGENKEPHQGRVDLTKTDQKETQSR